MIDTKINVSQILYDICEDEAVFEEDIDLVESGLLDSYAFIELFSILNDYEIYLEPTRIDRKELRTVKGIEKLIDDYISSISK